MHTVGILSFQGDFERHSKVFESLEVSTVFVHEPESLASVDALVIPGGESTAIGKLMVAFGVFEPLRERITKGMPVLGTCAGMILLARATEAKNQHRLEVLDIEIERNGYGRQVDSFETDLEIPVLGGSHLRGVFIRAPIVRAVGPSVEVLAELNGAPAMVKQGNILATSFHPELIQDNRIHRYFLDLSGRDHGDLGAPQSQE